MSRWSAYNLPCRQWACNSDKKKGEGDVKSAEAFKGRTDDGVKWVRLRYLQAWKPAGRKLPCSMNNKVETIEHGDVVNTE